jgi:hypothetical protein
MDSRFTSFLAWTGVVCAALMTTAICWGASAIVAMKSDIAVLLARPEAISRSEYQRDIERTDREIQQLRARFLDQRS